MWFLGLLLGLVLNVVAYLLLPKPKKERPPAAADWENPTAEAGRPIPVIFGTVIEKDLNVLWYGDKQVREYNIRA